MSDHFEVMPDYLAALELDLRTRATTPPTPRRLRRAWRRPAFAIAMAAMLIVPAVLSGRIGHDTRAYGRPAILAARPVRVPPSIGQGLELRVNAGPNANLKWARRFRAFGANAYLLNGDGIWCLSAPDHTSSDPGVERGVICAPTREFFRVGMQLVLRGRYIAVIPQGVKNPTVIHPDGTKESLRPNQQGVVAVEPIGRGDRFVLYGIDGQRKSIHAR